MTEGSFDPGEHIGQSVTVTGEAWTGAGGAMVMVGGGVPIYIDGLDSWSQEIDGKPVEVTGVLRLREPQVPSPPAGGIPRHGLDTETFVLDDAHWKPA